MTRIVIVAGAVLIAAIVAYAGYGMQQKRELRAQVTQLINAAGARLGESLGADINATSPEFAEKLARMDGEFDADLEKLRAARARPDRELADAAEAFVTSAAAVLKRQAGSARGRLKFTDSRKALAEHVGRAAQRNDGWIAEAIRLKGRLDADYFEYRLAATSLVNMLGELPAARAKVAAVLPGARLPEEAEIRDARVRATAGAEATRLEFEQSKQLVPR